MRLPLPARMDVFLTEAFTPVAPLSHLRERGPDLYCVVSLVTVPVLEVKNSVPAVASLPLSMNTAAAGRVPAAAGRGRRARGPARGGGAVGSPRRRRRASPAGGRGGVPDPPNRAPPTARDGRTAQQAGR